MESEQSYYCVTIKEAEKPGTEMELQLEVSCQLCTKLFASNTALENHMRSSHIEAYYNGDPEAWAYERKSSPPPKGPAPKRANTPNVTNPKPDRPSIMKTLSSEHVSYIIIKTESPPEDHVKTKKPVRKKGTKEERSKRYEKNKSVAENGADAITGPFECREPSTVSADGVCHQMFFSCCRYSAHQLSDHARPRRRQAKCQVCEQPLSLLHKNGDKEFTCEDMHCGKCFDTAEELADHTKAYHVPAKRFECTICLKKFSAKGGVVQHMRMHTGDRPYSCTMCPKAFTQKSGLEQHLRTHNKIKPFRCVICSKTFIQTVHLKQHMRTHTNVAPFQCVVCEKRFKQSSHLNYHLRHHPADETNMTDEQKRRFREVLRKIAQRQEEGGDGEDVQSAGEGRSTSMDRETALAEQSIQVEGTYDLSESCTFVDGQGTEKVICEVAEY